MPCTDGCLPRLVGKAKLDFDYWIEHLSVDPDRHRLYANGFRVDLSNPLDAKVTVLPNKSYSTVEPRTGRYATTTADGRTLKVFDPDDRLYDSQPMPGVVCGITSDPATGFFYVATETENQLVVYDSAAKRLHASRPLDFPPSEAIFEAASRRVYVISHSYDNNGTDQSLILDESYDDRGSVDGDVLAADAGHTYVATNFSSPPNLLEVRSSETWDLTKVQFDTQAFWVAPDPVLGRLYVRRADDIAVFDQSSGAYLSSLPMDDNFAIENVAFVPGDNRIYVEVFNYTGATPELDLLTFATQ